MNNFCSGYDDCYDLEGFSFYDETLWFIENYCKKSISDIVYIGDGLRHVSWEKFKELSDFFYDTSYGIHEISLGFRIIFNDKSYMRRWEYDGLERWEYICPLNVPEDSIELGDECREFPWHREGVGFPCKEWTGEKYGEHL